VASGKRGPCYIQPSRHWLCVTALPRFCLFVEQPELVDCFSWILPLSRGTLPVFARCAKALCAIDHHGIERLGWERGGLEHLPCSPGELTPEFGEPGRESVAVCIGCGGDEHGNQTVPGGEAKTTIREHVGGPGEHGGAVCEIDLPTEGERIARTCSCERSMVREGPRHENWPRTRTT